jgi:hypothetical protein
VAGRGIAIVTLMQILLPAGTAPVSVPLLHVVLTPVRVHWIDNELLPTILTPTTICPTSGALVTFTLRSLATRATFGVSVATAVCDGFAALTPETGPKVANAAQIGIGAHDLAPTLMFAVSMPMAGPGGPCGPVAPC